uniref:C2 NT-type domain-containing protein n=1 Tax=Anopheles maculatus TaxID=74869 RepID=A0A182SDB5_9DIPT
MSLTVRINKFQLPKAKANLLGRVEFRGVAHTTTELNCGAELSFIWPLARAADETETITVELRQQTTKILLKTAIGGTGGTSGSASSRGSITSSTKIIGRFVMLAQALIHEGRLRIEDRLVDLSNKPIDAFVSFDVYYQSPEDESGNFYSPRVVHSLHQQSSIDDDQQMLLNIEQNIANLEKSITQSKTTEPGTSSANARRTGRTGGNGGDRKPNIIKRVMSSGSAGLSERAPAPADHASSDNEASTRPTRSLADKKVTLRTVRNFMRLGRSRQSSRESTASSTEDEGKSLIGDSDYTRVQPDATDGEMVTGGRSTVGGGDGGEPTGPSDSPTHTGPGRAGENVSQTCSTHSNASSDGEDVTANEKLKK